MKITIHTKSNDPRTMDMRRVVNRDNIEHAIRSHLKMRCHTGPYTLTNNGKTKIVSYRDGDWHIIHEFTPSH